MVPQKNSLKSKVYNEDYFVEHAESGVGYLVFGEWHKAYARMITTATLQNTYTSPFMIEVGCACGAQLMGFKATAAYDGVFGIDMSEHMVNLGKKHFGYSEAEIMAGTATKMSIADGRASLVHSGQVLEHIPHEDVPALLAEFHRVLRPGGRTFHNLAARKYGDPPDIHTSDPTHVNVNSALYWNEKFSEAGFIADFESYDRFVRSTEAPGEGYSSFYNVYSVWTSLSYIKPLGAQIRQRAAQRSMALAKVLKAVGWE